VRHRRLAAAGAAAVLAVLLIPGAASAARPLQTAIVDGGPAFYGPQATLGFARVRQAGASAVRIYVGWGGTAPETPDKPAGFDAADPNDPHYDWSTLDRQVKLAAARGLEPILSPEFAPPWAETGSRDGFRPGSVRPDPVEYGLFATALARRYSGQTPGLPRVRYYQGWNEANVVTHLSPQFEGGRIVSPEHYRLMLEQFAAAVHAVHPDNAVIAGGNSAFANANSVGPMPFMRMLLCMSASDRPLPGCRPLHFDIWSHHPYTSGDPTHKARSRDSASLPDLKRMRRLLLAAVRAGHVEPNSPIRFWVTEFSWDTTPPDPRAVPVRLHARWVAESLYRMWAAGVSLVTWFQLRDDAKVNPAGHQATYESGLYFSCARGLTCDRPKPALTAFRFPFVAFRSGGRVLVWGRTPGGVRGNVVVEQKSGRSWRRLTSLRADRYGIFQRRVRPRGGGDMRARLRGSASSLAFSLRRPADVPVCPFGAPC
jgi:hypothetical protein